MSNSSFPVRLYEILSNPELEQIITWLPSGEAWTVVDPDAFTKTITPRYFRNQSKYASFMRQVNGWGFQRVSLGPGKSAYYHERFIRGRPDLVRTMTRQAACSTSADSNINVPYITTALAARGVMSSSSTYHNHGDATNMQVNASQPTSYQHFPPFTPPYYQHQQRAINYPRSMASRPWQESNTGPAFYDSNRSTSLSSYNPMNQVWTNTTTSNGGIPISSGTFRVPDSYHQHDQHQSHPLYGDYHPLTVAQTNATSYTSVSPHFSPAAVYHHQQQQLSPITNHSSYYPTFAAVTQPSPQADPRTGATFSSPQYHHGSYHTPSIQQLRGGTEVPGSEVNGVPPDPTKSSAS